MINSTETELSEYLIYLKNDEVEINFCDRFPERVSRARNPHWHLGQCVVCWGRGKRKLTSKYCRECALEARWTFKTRKPTTYHRYVSRLCSYECWRKFHEGQVYGLDHHMRSVSRGGPGSNTTPVVGSSTPATTPRQRRRDTQRNRRRLRNSGINFV